MSGIKHDQGKLRLDLITPEIRLALGSVLTFGAAKYGDRNWELGMDPSRLIAAAQRHLLSWEMGEIYDHESNLNHLWHALTNLGFLVTLEERKIKGGQNE